jgi:hypothetical protein
MTNQANATPFTFYDVSFDVATTGNADADFQIGNSMLLTYLKSLRDNFNENDPLPPQPAQLQNIIATLATDAALADVQRGFLVCLDMILQPMSHYMRPVLDKFSNDDLLADIANPTAE